MAKKNPDIRMVSYGRYTPFEKGGKELPKVLEFTTQIPARLGEEFGYILNIRQGRGLTLDFTIEHPPFADGDGNIAPPFTGEMFIDSNEYRFFLGDTIWAPPEDKIGDWTLTTRLNDAEIARKTFHIVMEESEDAPNDASHP